MYYVVVLLCLCSGKDGTHSIPGYLQCVNLLLCKLLLVTVVPNLSYFVGKCSRPCIDRLNYYVDGIIEIHEP